MLKRTVSALLVTLLLFGCKSEPEIPIDYDVSSDLFLSEHVIGKPFEVEKLEEYMASEEYSYFANVVNYAKTIESAWQDGDKDFDYEKYAELVEENEEKFLDVDNEIIAIGGVETTPVYVLQPFFDYQKEAVKIYSKAVWHIMEFGDEEDDIWGIDKMFKDADDKVAECRQFLRNEIHNEEFD